MNKDYITQQQDNLSSAYLASTQINQDNLDKLSYYSIKNYKELCNTAWGWLGQTLEDHDATNTK